MKTTTLIASAFALALVAGSIASIPARADGPSIPVWSGAPIATPGDGVLNQLSPSLGDHVNSHGDTRPNARD